MKDIDVIILCGGKGKRLGSLVKDTPKPMLYINKKPFLERIIEYFSSFGFKRFILCAGYKSEVIKDYINNYKKKDIEIFISIERKLLGTAGAIKNAENLIKKDIFLVTNGDTYCEVDFMKLIDFHILKGAIATIVVKKSDYTDDYGNIFLDKQNKIISFLEKEKKTNLINAGIYVFSKKILEFIPKNIYLSLEYDIFPNLIKKHTVYGFITDGFFIDIGTKERLEKAKRYLK